MSATTLHAGQSYDYIICGGGTAGCVVAGRLAEDPDAKILVLEAGPHSENLIGVHMPGGSAQNAGDETDWSIVSEKGAGINGRQVELTRGKFLGGSSGTNGTLCIRASKKDYDDWNLPGWSGEEFHRYMSKIVFLFYETEKPGLTNDHLIYPGAALDKTLQLWMEERKGFLASFPFGIFAFARLDERLADSSLWTTAHCKQGRDPMGLTRDQPNAVLFNFECYSGPQQFNQPPKEGQHAFSVLAELFGAKSRGTVALRSKDPMDGPEVDCGYLEDPLDAEVLGEACRFANEIIMEGAGTKGIVKGSWPPHLTHHTYSTREQWVAFARENATTCYHPSGTCAMGKVSDEKAVVDENLRVKGVKALRVVDVSIMPTLTGGHTQMAAYGIGEKAADLIKASWATSGR
ncbi:hypothetical protein ACHAQA_002596 [Verticillium albo-atrum]